MKPDQNVVIAGHLIPSGLLAGLAIGGVVYVCYAVATSRRVYRHLRRLAVCAAVAAAGSAVTVGLVDHIHHARLVATAGRMPLLKSLAYSWGGLTVIVTAVLFTLVTLVTRRRRPVRRRRPARGMPPLSPPGMNPAFYPPEMPGGIPGMPGGQPPGPVVINPGRRLR